MATRWVLPLAGQTHARNTAGDYIFDANEHPLFREGTDTKDLDGNVVVINGADGNPLERVGGPAIAQPGDPNAAYATYMTNVSAYVRGLINPTTRVAIAPGRANRAIIDYATKEGMALYSANTKALFDGTDDCPKFSMNGDGLLGLVDAISDRAGSAGWDIFNINWTDDAGTLVTKNLLKQYGEIKLEHVKAQAETIYTANNRTTQEDHQLYVCLTNSITSASKTTLNLHRIDYTVRDGFSGICYLRVIMREAQIDTRNTNNRLLQQLTSGMPNIMARHGNNIKAFNEEVQSILLRVQARGCNPGCNNIQRGSGLLFEWATCL
jgi:hypothetical protein